MATLEISKNKGLYFVIPEECGTGVKKVAGKVAKDVEGTLSFCPEICETAVPAKQAVIAVTAGSGKLAETLCSKISKLGQVEGKRESYAFIVAENPVEGIESALVIYGSDKLGTIYGLFHLSELLGVTAMVDWGDCQYVKQDSFILKEEDSFVSKEPSVKYRGFFINDEWPCCGNWATSHFGSFNAKMYDHIFEYLLRMKGNYLWPAMWAENFMLDGPDLESMKLADEYGIYMIAENNMETHGSWDTQAGKEHPDYTNVVPCDKEEWKGMLLDRVNSMYQRDKNHPAILIWSCGNESFGGSVIYEMSEFYRKEDPTRLVHYEGVFNDRRYNDTSDMESQMYPSVESIKEFLKKDRSKPFICCEYTHAMGNSCGAMHKYTDLTDTEPLYQGGFIWDYIDQSIYKKDRYGKEN